MREGNDLNQQGQGGRQEHASSRSPETFHDGSFLAVSAAVQVITLQAMSNGRIVNFGILVCIKHFFSFLRN
jgi:hypothetical protein